MGRNKLYVVIATALMSWGAGAETAVAANQTTAFTYQGQLNDHGALTSSVYPMTFTLYDAPTGGSIVAGPINQNIQVVNGLFTTDLDFGLIFGPTQYYLQIDVNGTPLSSRQLVNTVPVAQFALNGSAGPKGATGATGPAGATGATGAKGATGASGAAGTQGVQGAQGSQGSSGPQGNAGAQGVQGSVGAQGSQGDVGAQGSQGDAGPQGFQGNAGATGATGATGQGFNFVGPYSATGTYNPYDVVTEDGSSYVSLTGSNDDPASNSGPGGDWSLMAQAGATGAQGSQGSTGDTGPQGSQGSIGPQGFQGDIGPQGFQGDAGPQGFQGDAGPQGFQGDTGPQGFQGDAGATGQGFNFVGPYSATGTYNPYDVVTEDGSSYVSLTGSNDDPAANSGPGGDWSLMAQAGATGPQGVQGFQGLRGAQGNQGFQGVQGSQGSQGFQGAQGSQGAQGPRGFQGFQGVQGAQGAQGAQGSQGTTSVSGSKDIRAGTFTVSSAGTTQHVTFSSPINGANFSVSILTTGTTGGIGGNAFEPGCIFNIESQNANSFTFSCRTANFGTQLTIPVGASFQYIAITEN